MMYNRDNLEEAILEVYDAQTSLTQAYKYACEASEEEFNQESIANLLLGTLELSNIRLVNLYRVFDEMESDARII